jgi:hypothetical protein
MFDDFCPHSCQFFIISPPFRSTCFDEWAFGGRLFGGVKNKGLKYFCLLILCMSSIHRPLIFGVIISSVS